MRIFTCFLFLLFGSSLFSGTTDESLIKLSFLERYYMKVFFDEAITKDQAAHVIFYDNKPISQTGPAIIYHHKKFRDKISLKGWKVFKKYEHLFPHPNFIFTENICKNSKDSKTLQIYIINKMSLRSCLNTHLNLFQETLGPSFSIDTFISQLENGDSLPSLIDENEMLLGVLFGYGEESSKAFNKVVKECTDDHIPPSTKTYQEIGLKTPEKCKIQPVVFMGNPDSKEVEALKSTYEKELDGFWPKYKKSKEHLKIILDGLRK